MENFLGDSSIQHLTEFLLDRLAISGFMASAAMDITISDREVFSL
jgi:hypothetical protein